MNSGMNSHISAEPFDEFIIGIETCSSGFTFQFHEFVIWLNNTNFILVKANSTRMISFLAETSDGTKNFMVRKNLKEI